MVKVYAFRPLEARKPLSETESDALEWDIRPLRLMGYIHRPGRCVRFPLPFLDLQNGGKAL